MTQNSVLSGALDRSGLSSACACSFRIGVSFGSFSLLINLKFFHRDNHNFVRRDIIGDTNAVSVALEHLMDIGYIPAHTMDDFSIWIYHTYPLSV